MSGETGGAARDTEIEAACTPPHRLWDILFGGSGSDSLLEVVWKDSGRNIDVRVENLSENLNSPRE